MGQNRESLRDLDGVRVSVEALPDRARIYGLSVEAVQRSVESTLGQAHITVLGIGDFPVGDPFLRVRIDVTAEERGAVAFTVEVDFVQIVFMRRNPAVTFNRAETWRATPRLGLAAPAEVGRRVRLALSEQVDEFVHDYRLVNGS